MDYADGAASRIAAPPAAGILAAYAAALRFDDLPPEVRRRAKDCLIDTVAAAIHGAELPWSRMIRAQAAEAGPGRCRVIGAAHAGRNATAAAFANAVSAHAAELDCLRFPGVGVHPGAVLVPAALAAAQDRGADGRALLTAIVAGAEVLIRIGKASRHSAEKRGFHAPGITGPYGAAIAAGKIYGLGAAGLANALAIAGSLGGGLLEFANAQEGGMVKRLHLGRAAESGVLAARLAADGFTGPARVLEGRFGFLNTYCADADPAALTAGLGREHETLTLCFKRYPCHITAHTPITALRALREEHGFAPADISRITIAGSSKMAELHGGQAPGDLVMALYSIPFCAAVAIVRDAADPDSFGPSALDDPAVRALSARITVTDGGNTGWATHTRVELADGRVLERAARSFPGMPDQPLTPAGLGAKFRALTRRLGMAAGTLLERLEHVEEESDLAWIGAAAGERA